MTIQILIAIILVFILTRADESKTYYEAELTTNPLIQESFTIENLRIVIWFRIVNYFYSNDQPMFVISGKDQIDKMTYIMMRFCFHPLERQISVKFDKEVKYIKYDEYSWSQLLIVNQGNNIYDQFAITFQTNSRSATITRQQLRNTYYPFNLNFSLGYIQYTQIQISNSILINLCQPGCRICADNVFQCYVCSHQHILQNQDEQCDCPLFWNQVSSSQCLKDQLVLYESINTQVSMDNFLAKLQQDNSCKDDGRDFNTLLSLYELDSIKNSLQQQLDLIYLQIDESRSLEWYYATQNFIKLEKALILLLNSEFEIYKLTFDMKHYVVQNISAIHRPIDCEARQNINLTIIGLYVINQNISETLFYQNKQLRIIEFNIQDSVINNSTLFKSKTIIIDGFIMLNCTLNNSQILFSQFLQLKNVQIRNSTFINSSVISSKLHTLVILNLFSENILMFGTSYFFNIIEGHQLELYNIYSWDCLFQAGFLKISALNITMTNITFQSINQFNYQLLAIINIYAQNLSIVNLILNNVQGIYLNPLICLLSEHLESSFRIYNMTIKSFQVQVIKLDNLIYIIQTHQGSTSLENLIMDNVTLNQQNIMFHILTNEFSLQNGSIILSDSQPGFTIEAYTINIQGMFFQFRQQDIDSDYFIVLKSNFITIIKCRFLQSSQSLILISLIQAKQSSQFLFSDCEIQNQQTSGVKRYYIQLEKVAKVTILRSNFYGPIQRMPSLFSITGAQNTLISDCIINYITNFISIEQFNQSSEILVLNLKVENICIKQDKNSFTYALLRVFQGQVTIKDFQMTQACNPIELNQISSLLIDGYRAKEINVYSALISVISWQDIAITIKNAFFKGMLIKSSVLDGLIYIQNQNSVNLVMDFIYFNDIRSDTDHQALIGIFSQNFSATINQLIIFDCSCSHQCISIRNEVGTLMIDNSTFLRNSVNEFFSISNTNNYIVINNSLFMLNRLLNVGGINSIFSSNCEFLYNELSQNIDIDKLKSSNRILDYPTDIQVILSLNGGLQYSINQRLSKNNFVLKLKNGNSVTNQFYIPTGQPFNDFILFNYKSTTYKQQRIDLYYSIKNVSDNQYCTLQYLNKSLEFQLLSQHWDQFMVISKPDTVIKFTVICSVQGVNHSLVYFGRTMKCQLGEFLYMDKCIRCLPELFQYSVQKQSQYCKTIDIRTMKEVQYALLNLYDGYWRPNIHNDVIESCIQSQNSCNGGFKVGNQLCHLGFVGAICSDCDTTNLLGNGMFIKDSLNKCQLCNFLWSDIIKFCFCALLQYELYNQFCLFYLFEHKLVLLYFKIEKN